MEKYFSADIHLEPFHMFSTSHIITLLIFVVLNIFLVIWFIKRKTERSVDYFRYFLAAIIVLNETLVLFWCIKAGFFTLDYALPLELCDAAAILSVIMLIKGYRTSFELVYFWGLGGSLQAMITPALYYPFPHFMFFSFFLLHGSVLTSIFYMLAVKGYKPTWKSIGKTFVYTNLYAGLVALVDLFTGGNYMFLCHKPGGASIIDFLGPWPWYILSLEGVLLVTCLILYIPFAVKNLLVQK